METMGYHKRDIMVDRVQEARDAQEEAKEQFESALEKFSSVLGFKGGDLEEKYAQLIGAMKRAEKKIDPVLAAFKDQVLYLKHNLNAQAIASLQSELASIETDVAKLIKEMEASIREARIGTCFRLLPFCPGAALQCRSEFL
jgi:hypothetical protein